VRSPPVLPPVQPEFHPEFGYFWPAAHTRRMVRIGLLSTAFGAMVGAIVAIAMTHRGDADADADAVQSVLAVQAPRTVGAAPAATAAAAVTAVTPTVAAQSAVSPSPVEAAPKTAGGATSPAAHANSCNEQTWPYLDSKCIKNSTRKRQQVRVLKPETPAQSAPAETALSATPESSAGTAAAVKSQEPPKVSNKREKKIARSRERRRDRDFADTDRSRTFRERERDDTERGRYVDSRSAYESPYERRYEVRGGWGW
jgi:hypothetical protein